MPKAYADAYKTDLNKIQKRQKPRSLPNKFQKLNECEVDFMIYVQGKLPLQLQGNTELNPWEELFDVREMIKQFEPLTSEQRLDWFNNLVGLSKKDKIFAQNISDLGTWLYKNKLLSYVEVKKVLTSKRYGETRYFYNKRTKKFMSSVEFNKEKVQVISEILASQDKLSKSVLKEYERILLSSNLDAKMLKFALDHNLKLHAGDRYIRQFSEYFEFLDELPHSVVKRGLKKVEGIYNFNYFHDYGFSINPGPQQQFLMQQSRNRQFQDRRFIEIMNSFKLKERHNVIEEIDELVKREHAGEVIDPRERLRLKKKLDDIEIPHSLRERALIQASGEASILRKIKNGCNRGNSPEIKATAKKFSRFKFGLALTTTPAFYYMKNKDKMDTDPYWWERLGYEMFVGLVFTWVANKIFTNNNTSLLMKYISGYLKFGALDYISNAVGYEELFGSTAMVRYFQGLYKSQLPESEVEKEFNKLVNSPTFEKDVKELLEYLEKENEKFNTKQVLEKYLKLGDGFNSLTDEDKLTLQDLESPEAREIIMELVAERLYYSNMGNMPFFQTGSPGNDRWLFYRMRNIGWDVKGLLVNFAIFQIMCREPFGKAGSLMAVVGLIIANEMIGGNLTYGWRRHAINQ